MTGKLPTFDVLDLLDNDYPDERIFPDEDDTEDGEEKSLAMNHPPKDGNLVFNEYWNITVKPKTGNWNKYQDTRNRYGYGSEPWLVCMYAPIHRILNSLTSDDNGIFIVYEFVLNMNTRKIENENSKYCGLVRKNFMKPHVTIATKGEILCAIELNRNNWNDSRFWSCSEEKRVYQILHTSRKTPENPDQPVMKYIWKFAVVNIDY